MNFNQKLLLEYIQHIKGHKNSKGEPAPWVIKSHKTGKILSSHKTKEEAKKHLQHMHIFKEDSEESLAERLIERWLEKHNLYKLYTETVYDLKIKPISFPSEELEQLKKQDKIFTTRVDADYNKYNINDIVETTWGEKFKVIKRININSLEKHPYLTELTQKQKKILSKYDKIACLWLSKIKDDSVNSIYSYSFKCSDEDSGDYLQEIVHYDTLADNEYSIQDEYLNNGTIKILSAEEFNKMTGNFDMMEICKFPIDFYAMNTDMDILFAYCSENDIHYFFEK